MQTTRKEREVIRARDRPLPCRVSNLPSGVICAYRAHYPYEQANHEKKHSKALREGLKNNSRFYEMSEEELKTLRNKLNQLIFTSNENQERSEECHPKCYEPTDQTENISDTLDDTDDTSPLDYSSSVFLDDQSEQLNLNVILPNQTPP